MGRKKRCAYWMKAMRMPMVTMCRKKLQWTRAVQAG
jgi:hypothetical protein